MSEGALFLQATVNGRRVRFSVLCQSSGNLLNVTSRHVGVLGGKAYQLDVQTFIGRQQAANYAAEQIRDQTGHYVTDDTSRSYR